MGNALEVRGLWKSYAVGVRGCSARISVLRGVSFSVAPGEVLAIVGAAGAGKTTLLHCIAGLRRADAGSVRRDDAMRGRVVLLDDDGSLGAPAPPDAVTAMLLFARSPARVARAVDRVLLLRDGRVTALESSSIPRQVAERAPARRGE